MTAMAYVAMQMCRLRALLILASCTNICIYFFLLNSASQYRFCIAQSFALIRPNIFIGISRSALSVMRRLFLHASVMIINTKWLPCVCLSSRSCGGRDRIRALQLVLAHVSHILSTVAASFLSNQFLSLSLDTSATDMFSTHPTHLPPPHSL